MGRSTSALATGPRARKTSAQSSLQDNGALCCEPAFGLLLIVCLPISATAFETTVHVPRRCTRYSSDGSTSPLSAAAAVDPLPVAESDNAPLVGRGLGALADAIATRTQRAAIKLAFPDGAFASLSVTHPSLGRSGGGGAEKDRSEQIHKLNATMINKKQISTNSCCCECSFQIWTSSCGAQGSYLTRKRTSKSQATASTHAECILNII